MERSKMFPVSAVGYLLVFIDPNDQGYLPPVLLCERDDVMPELSDLEQCKKRIEWESTRFKRAFELANTSEAELTPSDAEAKEMIRPPDPDKMRERVQQLRKFKQKR